MHPLDRIRQVSSYALAVLLVVNAAFCFAMLTLGVANAVRGEPWHASHFGWFAALTATFAGGAWFFWWFGKTAGR